jgi:hypothetical protein
MNYKLLSELTILTESGHERLSITARSAVSEIEKLYREIGKLDAIIDVKDRKIGDLEYEVYLLKKKEED